VERGGETGAHFEKITQHLLGGENSKETGLGPEPSLRAVGVSNFLTPNSRLWLTNSVRQKTYTKNEKIKIL